jgi:hypothetical protein
LNFSTSDSPAGCVFGDGKRRGAAAGHERGQRAVRAEKFLVQREHGMLFQRRGFERIVKFRAGGAQIAGLKREPVFARGPAGRSTPPGNAPDFDKPTAWKCRSRDE